MKNLLIALLILGGFVLYSCNKSIDIPEVDPFEQTFIPAQDAPFDGAFTRMRFVKLPTQFGEAWHGLAAGYFYKPGPYGAQARGFLMYSADSGRSWNVNSIFNNVFFIEDMYADSSGLLLLLADGNQRSTLIYSNSLLAFGHESREIMGALNSAQCLYVGGGDLIIAAVSGELFLSNNLGWTWKKVIEHDQGFEYRYLKKIYMNQLGTLIALGYRHNIEYAYHNIDSFRPLGFYSNDQGNTWTEFNPGYSFTELGEPVKRNSSYETIGFRRDRSMYVWLSSPDGMVWTEKYGSNNPALYNLAAEDNRSILLGTWPMLFNSSGTLEEEYKPLSYQVDLTDLVMLDQELGVALGGKRHVKVFPNGGSIVYKTQSRIYTLTLPLD